MTKKTRNFLDTYANISLPVVVVEHTNFCVDFFLVSRRLVTHSKKYRIQTHRRNFVCMFNSFIIESIDSIHFVSQSCSFVCTHSDFEHSTAFSNSRFVIFSALVRQRRDELSGGWSGGVEVGKLIWLIFDIHFQFEPESEFFVHTKLFFGEEEMSQFSRMFCVCVCKLPRDYKTTLSSSEVRRSSTPTIFFPYAIKCGRVEGVLEKLSHFLPATCDVYQTCSFLHRHRF